MPDVPIDYSSASLTEEIRGMVKAVGLGLHVLRLRPATDQELKDCERGCHLTAASVLDDNFLVGMEQEKDFDDVLVVMTRKSANDSWKTADVVGDSDMDDNIKPPNVGGAFAEAVRHLCLFRMKLVGMA